MVERESREIVIDVVLELANLSVGGKAEEVCMIGLCFGNVYTIKSEAS